jgi:L-threonylcarbamoyladenylate synthase
MGLDDVADEVSMTARVVEVDPEAPDVAAIADATALLAAGQLVAFPTETVYGLGARALDPAALARIFAAKGRPPTHPLIAHVLDVVAARALADGWDSRAEALAARFWPGPLTLVMARAASVPAALSGGKPTVALRAPAHAVARALIAALGEPIAAPSANRYQSLSPTTAAHVVRSLGEVVPLVLDGGACTSGLESTVVDLTQGTARLLRPGALPLGELRAIVPEIVRADGIVDDEATRHSPGQDAVHYAPRAELRLLGRQSAIAAAEAYGAGAALLARGRVPAGLSPPLKAIALPDDPIEYGRGLFAALHALDDGGVRLIVVEAPPAADEAWLAIEDRLTRASRKRG